MNSFRFYVQNNIFPIMTCMDGLKYRWKFFGFGFWHFHLQIMRWYKSCFGGGCTIFAKWIITFLTLMEQISKPPSKQSKAKKNCFLEGGQQFLRLLTWPWAFHIWVKWTLAASPGGLGGRPPPHIRIKRVY